MYSFIHWVSLFFSTAAILANSSPTEEKKAQHGVSTIYGQWLQIYSDRYVQTTSEVDYSCVTVNVLPVFSLSTPMVSVNKHAYQHGNQHMPLKWSQNYSISWSLDSSSVLQDNLVLAPVKGSSSVVTPLWLRRATDNYIVWTGMDNKTMFVWAHEFSPPEEKSRILQQLADLDFNGTYKTPLSSFSEICFSLPPSL